MVPPRRKALVAADPLANLSRLLLQLKLKAAPLAANGPTKAAQDCKKAAEAFSVAVSAAETGAPALQLLLGQGTNSSAAELFDRTKQLLACTAETTEALGQRRQQLPHDTAWLLLQPVLRLLLWLLPEHVPQHPQQHQEPGSSTRAAAAVHAPAAHYGSVNGQDPQTQSASGDWRYSLGLAYAREVIKPALYQALRPALKWLLKTSPLNDYPAPTQEGFRVMEECLLWVALIRRLRNLAAEMEGDEPSAISTPAGLPGPPQHTLSGSNLLSEITGDSTILVPVATHVFSWLRGRCWRLAQMPTPAQQSAVVMRGSDKERAVCTAFAASFQPSSHLAAVASGPFSILGQRLASLLSDVHFRSLACNDLHWSECSALGGAYNGMLSYLLPGGILELSGADRAGYLQHLAHHVEMNLRGLALTHRLQLGSNTPQQLLSHDWHNAAVSVGAAVQMVLTRLRETWPPQMGVFSVEQSLAYPPHYASAPEPSPHRGLLRYFVDQNLEARMWPHQRRQALLPADQGLHSDWLQAACVAADALHLLRDACVTKQCLPSGDQGVADNESLLRSVFGLLPWLRPPSPADYMAGAATTRGWAVCLMTLSSMLDAVVSKPAASSQQQQGVLGDVLGLRVLLEDVLGLRVLLGEVLPVLTYAASTLCRPSSRSQGAQSSSRQTAPPHDSMAQAAYARDAPTGSSLPSSQSSLPCTSSRAAPRVPAVPVESTLLLLGASAHLLRHCVSFAIGSKDFYRSLSRSTAPATRTPRQDDLVAALDAVLALAAHLISDGPWWQQAKAHYPLLLIETLSATAKSLCSIMQGLLESTEPHEPLWSYVTAWSKPVAALQSHQSSFCLSSAASEPVAMQQATRPAAAAAAAAAAEAAAGSSYDCAATPRQSGSMPAPPPRLPSCCVAGATAAASTAAGSCADTGSTGAGEAISGSTHSRPQNPPSAQHMNIMALTCELFARLWELLTDATIVGEAQGPAAWMPSTMQHAKDTWAALWCMLRCCDVNVRVSLLQVQRSPGGGDGARSSRDNGLPSTLGMPREQCGTAGKDSLGGCSTSQRPVEPEKPAHQRMLQLSSLALAVPWERLKTAAAKLGRTSVLEFLQIAEGSCEAVNAHIRAFIRA